MSNAFANFPVNEPDHSEYEILTAFSEWGEALGGNQVPQPQLNAFASFPQVDIPANRPSVVRELFPPIEVQPVVMTISPRASSNSLPFNSGGMIRLRCSKIANKLRVRIVTGGYNPTANCQFPRNIRHEGREYLVPVSSISFSQTGQKFFYRVKKNGIQIIDTHDSRYGQRESSPAISSEVTLKKNPKKIEKVFGDDEDMECAVCFDADKDAVFNSCGHFCCCMACATQIAYGTHANCPICRAKIIGVVARSDMA